MIPDGRFLVGGEWRESNSSDEIRNPWSQETIGVAARASRADVEEAITAAVESFPAWSRRPAWQRAEVLRATSERLAEQQEEFARLLSSECAKPIRDARVEVQRAVTTFRLASEEATRVPGELLPLDVNALAGSKLGLVRRFPIGVISAITPFNFPLNLVAHKVAPALAAGNTVVLKPAPTTPLTALKLARILIECGLPAGVLNVVTPGNDDAVPLVEDPRVSMLSFTGSSVVGWALRARAGRKRVTLELGGDAAVVVEADANLDLAAKAIARGAYAYAGQVCISVQRIFVHHAVASDFRVRLEDATRALVLGDPADERSDLSVMIDSAAAERVDQWIDEAIEDGASALVRGMRERNILPPALLWDAAPTSRVCNEEAFGPIATIQVHRDLEQAISLVNGSRYGLQAGIFTSDLTRVMRAWEALAVGGVVVNEAPGFRIDSMPYGGVKESGTGREGVRYAMESMSEPRLLLIDR